MMPEAHSSGGNFLVFLDNIVLQRNNHLNNRRHVLLHNDKLQYAYLGHCYIIENKAHLNINMINRYLMENELNMS